MDKADLRATARELVSDVNVGGLTALMFKRRVDKIEAALTAAYDQGWNEAVEACHSSHTVANVSDRVMAIRGGKKVWSAGVAAKKRAIRRLKKGKGCDG